MGRLAGFRFKNTQAEPERVFRLLQRRLETEERPDAESRNAMGLLRRRLGLRWFDAITHRRRRRIVRLLRTRIPKLDAAWAARRADSVDIRGTGLAQSKAHAMAEGLEQHRSGDRICLAGSLVWRWADHGSRRLSIELS